jgi:hypothetical protein
MAWENDLASRGHWPFLLISSFSPLAQTSLRGTAGLPVASCSKQPPPNRSENPIHGAFMTFPAYSRSREGEGQELGFGVSEERLSHRSISPRGSLTPEQ